VGRREDVAAFLMAEDFQQLIVKSIVFRCQLAIVWNRDDLVLVEAKIPVVEVVQLLYGYRCGDDQRYGDGKLDHDERFADAALSLLPSPVGL